MLRNRVMRPSFEEAATGAPGPNEDAERPCGRQAGKLAIRTTPRRARNNGRTSAAASSPAAQGDRQGSAIHFTALTLIEATDSNACFSALPSGSALEPTE